jgi:hypothetical protein
MSPTKERNLRESGTDETSRYRKENSLGTLSPDPWDFIAVDANPSCCF